MSGSLGKKGFFSRAIALYVPWPKVAGKSFDRDAIYEGVNSIGKALEKICGASFNHFDNVDCESFRTQMAEFIKTCTKQKPDEAIVYICTHGIKHPDTEELYLMMADSKNPKDPQFYKSSISRNEVIQYIQQLEQAIPHGKVLVLLDCCHSGALFPDRAETLGYTNVRHSQARKVVHDGGRGRAVFMSCKSNEFSYISDNCPRFTKAVGETLMEFPKGEAIDLSKLILVVKEKVKAWSSKSQPQHPWEEPPCWSQRGKEFGNVGLGAAESMYESMDTDQEHESGTEIFLGPRTVKKWIPDDASPDKVKEYFQQIQDTVSKLEISMKEANAPQSIKDLIKKAQADWSEFSFEGVTRVVICGGTGHGKSTLINALVGEEVLPAGDDGGACTSAVIEVESNTTDDLFKAKVHFLSRAEWKELLKSWVHFKDNRVKEVDKDADGILKALFSGPIPESLDDMINHENVREQISQGMVDIIEENIDDFVEKLENYVLQCKRGSNLFPIVKKVTVFVPSSTLRQDIVLVDIPGYCDSSHLRKDIAEKQFKEGDIVWIVAGAPRALPNEIAHGLVAEVLKGSISRSCNLAYICTQNDIISKPKDYVRNFEEDELDPLKKESQEEIKRLLEEQKKEKKAGKRRVLEQKLMVQCSYWRRHNLRVELQKATQDMFEKEKLRKQNIGVFTVSALDHLMLLKKGSPKLFTEEKDTGILELQGYAHKAVDKHRRFKVEEAYQDLLRLCLKLKTKVQSKAQDEQQWEESLEALLLEVNKVINQLNKEINKNVEAVVAVTKKITEPFSSGSKNVLVYCDGKYEVVSLFFSGHQILKELVIDSYRTERAFKDTNRSVPALFKNILTLQNSLVIMQLFSAH